MRESLSMIRYITDIQSAPPHFEFISFTVKDLTDSLVVCYTKSISHIESLVPHYMHAVRGCLVTPDGNLSFTPLTDNLWHITVPLPFPSNFSFLLEGIIQLMSKNKKLQQENNLLKQEISVVRDELNSTVLNLQTQMEEARELNRELSKNEALFRTQFELGNIGIALTSVEKGWLKVNPRLCQILGYSQNELLKRTWQEMTYPQDLEADLIQFQRVLKGDIDGYELDKRFIRKDGSIAFTHLAVSCFRNPNRSVNFIIASIIDITEHKKAEKDLRNKENILQAVFNSTPVMFWIKDTNNRLLRINKAAAALHGKSPEELEGKSDYDLYPYEKAHRYWLDDLSVITSKTTKISYLEPHVEPGTEETHWLQIGKVPILSGEEVTGIIISGVDITDLKKAEEDLQTANAKLEAILSAMPDLLFEVDSEGRIYNYRCRDDSNLYVPQNHFLMKKMVDILPFQATKIIMESIEQALKTGYDYGSCYSLNMKGVTKWYELSVSLEKTWDLENPRLILLPRDITERKEREEQLAQKNEELTRFNYTISHDLKSPLVTFNAFIGRLEKDLAQGRMEKVGESLTYIKNASRKMSALLEDLLRFSRLGYRRNHFQETSFQTVTREALELTAGLFESKKIRIRKTEEDTPLFGDKAQLIELYQNLIENAVKYMGDSSEPFIELGFSAPPEGTEFFVRDNGIGINPDHLEVIFNIFEKLDPQTDGSGVGLALVRRIVENHGGKIRAESEGPGKGACFYFTLQILPPEKSGT